MIAPLYSEPQAHLSPFANKPAPTAVFHGRSRRAKERNPGTIARGVAVPPEAHSHAPNP